MNSVQDHMTPAQRAGGVDITSALIAAQAYADHVIVPPGSYRLDGTIPVLSGKTWVFQGSRFSRSAAAGPMFSAVGADEWKFVGDLTLQGVRAGAEKGLYVKDAKRWAVDRITAKGLTAAVEVDGGGAAGDVGYYGQTGHIAALDLWGNDVGFRTVAGASGEYCVVSAMRASGNQQAVDIAAGNTRILGGNISANVNGVRLRGGANHGHGVIGSTWITHNTGLNVLAEDVVYGFLLQGCLIVGDTPSVGKVLLNGCSGISIRDGDLYVVIESNNPAGWSVVENNRIHGSPTITQIAGSHPQWVMAKGNYVPGSSYPPAAPMWAGNNCE